MAGLKRDPKNPLLQKNFMAPFKLLARLQVLSEKEGVSESEIIRKALERYLTDEASAQLSRVSSTPPQDTRRCPR
jgi:hypothetical protein